MTCIVAWLRKDDVLIGGDAAAVAGLDIDTRSTPKVFVNGPMIFGFTTSFRMGDLLQYALEIPERDERHQSVDKYMRTTFVDAVRKCLKDGGYARKENEVEAAGTFLVGYEGRIFEVNSDYQVGESRMPFAAIGCGETYAKGSMMTALGAADSKEISDPRAILEEALNVASHFSAGVRPPFTFIAGGQRTDKASLPLAA